MLGTYIFKSLNHRVSYPILYFIKKIMSRPILPLVVILLTLAACLAQQCPHCKDHLDLNCVDLPTESPNGSFIGFHIVYDPIKANPILVNTLFNSLNSQKSSDRGDAFKKYICSENSQIDQISCGNTIKGTPEQGAYSNRSVTPWDRGHLAPSLPFTYSDQANAQSFLCLNVAPQDWFTNQQPWRLLEDRVLSYFGGDKAGYVMTGLCDQDAPGFMNATLDGFHVPACYWKMVCYKDESGVAQVVGFIGNNTITRGGNTADMAERRRTVCEPRSQLEVLNHLKPERWAVVGKGWVDGEEVLLPGRKETRAPLASECVEKVTLETQVKEEWVGVLRGC